MRVAASINRLLTDASHPSRILVILTINPDTVDQPLGSQFFAIPIHHDPPGLQFDVLIDNLCIAEQNRLPLADRIVNRLRL
jgi:hypothetical protein